MSHLDNRAERLLESHGATSMNEARAQILEDDRRLMSSALDRDLACGEVSEIVRPIEVDRVFWTIVRTGDGFYAAYPEEAYASDHGMACLIAEDLLTLVRGVHNG